MFSALPATADIQSHGRPLKIGPVGRRRALSDYATPFAMLPAMTLAPLREQLSLVAG
jgi:hypothetical protein